MKKPEKSAAVVSIKDAAKMTKRGRKAIAEWLRKHAEMLEEHGTDYASQFRGRYLYR